MHHAQWKFLLSGMKFVLIKAKQYYIYIYILLKSEVGLPLWKWISCDGLVRIALFTGLFVRLFASHGILILPGWTDSKCPYQMCLRQVTGMVVHFVKGGQQTLKMIVFINSWDLQQNRRARTNAIIDKPIDVFAIDYWFIVKLMVKPLQVYLNRRIYFASKFLNIPRSILIQSWFPSHVRCFTNFISTLSVS